MWRFVVQQAIRHSAVLVVWAVSYSWWMVPLLALFTFSLSQAEPLNLVEVFASFWLLDHLTSQIQYIPHSLSLYGTAAAGATRMISLLAQPELNQSFVPDSPEGIDPTAKPTALEIRNLTVRYGSKEVLKNLTITFSLTERTAIIGSVGSGKSTLLEVLLGELPFTSGKIEVHFSDGSCGPLWRRDVYTAFRRAVAYSPQQPFLSNTSMRNNVDLSGTAAFENVQQAVALAQLNDDILLFERGLEEEVGESGINLSGGQKQRVSLARAFISKRTVWLLDDPLSAVDTQTEQRLLSAITARAEGLIIVSHRMSALERCDRVIVLEDGLIVEDGDPQRLTADASSRLSRFMQAVEEHEH
jgi:ABC-type multidrug transport system fused ATPase/permease subunit